MDHDPNRLLPFFPPELKDYSQEDLVCLIVLKLQFGSYHVIENKGLLRHLLEFCRDHYGQNDARNQFLDALRYCYMTLCVHPIPLLNEARELANWYWLIILPKMKDMVTIRKQPLYVLKEEVPDNAQNVAIEDVLQDAPPIYAFEDAPVESMDAGVQDELHALANAALEDDAPVEDDVSMDAGAQDELYALANAAPIDSDALVNAALEDDAPNALVQANALNALVQADAPNALVQDDAPIDALNAQDDAPNALNAQDDDDAMESPGPVAREPGYRARNQARRNRCMASRSPGKQSIPWKAMVLEALRNGEWMSFDAVRDYLSDHHTDKLQQVFYHVFLKKTRDRLKELVEEGIAERKDNSFRLI